MNERTDIKIFIASSGELKGYQERILRRLATRRRAAKKNNLLIFNIFIP